LSGAFDAGRQPDRRKLILDFALRYDPQPFHLDVEAARASNYGGLIASGFRPWRSASASFSISAIFRACGMGSPGLDELRWPRPVRPGDTIRSELHRQRDPPVALEADRGHADDVGAGAQPARRGGDDVSRALQLTSGGRGDRAISRQTATTI